MPETLCKSERSRVMAAVKSRDTAPELIVRRLIHQLGYRFRLHRRSLPGTPDIVLPRLRKVINVHGCFWHMHACQRKRTPPVTNAYYWSAKRTRNVERDHKNLALLRRQGWQVLTVWECQTRDLSMLSKRLAEFLSK